MGGTESRCSECFRALRGHRHSGALRVVSGATPDANRVPRPMEECPLVAGLPTEGATQKAEELVAPQPIKKEPQDGKAFAVESIPVDELSGEEGKPASIETSSMHELSGEEEHATETGSSSSTGPYHDQSGSLDLDNDFEIQLSFEEDDKPLTANCVKFNLTNKGDAHVGPFTVEAELGSGGQALVFRAKHDNGRLVALKVAKNRDDFAALEQEQSTLSTLNHPNIMRLVEGFRSSAYLVLELHTGGDLFMFARQNASPQRSVGTEVAMQAMFSEVLTGVHYLHSKNFAHKDIKLPNLLLHEEGSQRVVLGDFAADEAIPGTAGYMSEEVYDSRGARGRPYCVYAADLWACGCVWWGLMNGTNMPFQFGRPSLCQYLLPNVVDCAQPDKAFVMLDPLVNREPLNRDLDRAIALAAELLAVLQAMQ